MITRILPPDEWHRLAGTDMAPNLSPHTCVVVVEDRERIIGCWAFVLCLHAEDLWIADDHRQKGAVARRLLKGAAAVAADTGVQSVCVGVADPDVAAFVTRLGGSVLDGVPYVMPIGRFQS